MLETKLKLVRNKILMLLQNFGRDEEKQGNLETLPNDELLKRITDLLQSYKDREQYFTYNHNRMKSNGSLAC
jgi:hypothetical protein